MNPAARLQSAVEALSRIENAIGIKGPAADSLLKDFFKERRYAGSGDRRAISERVYQILRERGLLLWLCAKAGLPGDARSMALAHCALRHSDDLIWFGHQPYGPRALSDNEQKAVQNFKAFDTGAVPLGARWNAPDDIAQILDARFGEGEREALNDRASVDLRTNTLLIDRVALLHRLAEEGVEAHPTPYSPWGIRLTKHVFLENHPLFRAGLFELQDEGSQLVSLLCGAKPGQRLIDLCAGGGGKTLALAALCGGDADILACDVDGGRLDRMTPRLNRAGITCVRTLLLPLRGDKRREALAGLANSTDLVLVDAPCSGTGTWRRHPEARWRYDVQDIQGFQETQDSLLDEAVVLARPGGRIAYVTCSLLPNEGENRVSAALARHKSLRLLDYRQAGGDLPETASKNPACLLLTPHRHGTDGFFFAIFERLDD